MFICIPRFIFEQILAFGWLYFKKDDSVTRCRLEDYAGGDFRDNGKTIGFCSHTYLGLLMNRVASNPDFFIEVLTYLYRPSSDERAESEAKELPVELLENRAHLAYQLLNSWKRLPGLREDETLDDEYLRDWVSTVRYKAKIIDREEVADIQIGNILAQYPETNAPQWPPDVIADLIESINTSSIKNNFSAALRNKRGSSSRAAFAGGDIERGHADYFKKIAEYNSATHPILSEIFDNISKGFLYDAKRQDEDAERDKLDF